MCVADRQSSCTHQPPGALQVEPLQAGKLCVQEDPRLTAVLQHRRHDRLVEHPRHWGGHALLRNDVAKAALHPASASKLAPRGEDIAVIVRDDASQICT